MHDTRLPSSSPMIWSQVPKASPRDYVLTHDERPVARLRWQKVWGSLAIGESPEGSWSLKRVGFLSTRVAVRAVDSDMEVASFYPYMFGGGRVELSDGRHFRLGSRGFLNPQYDLLDGSGQVVIALKVRGWGKSGELRYGPAKPDEKTSSLLSLLLWHVTLLAREDANSVVVMTGTLAAVV